MPELTALEFFSGIGAFAQAARKNNVQVVAAFDQNESANEAYYHNFGLRPFSSNLDTVKPDQLPDASLWWMSPPCTPFSVRGSRKDDEDPRARSFIHLIDLAATIRPDIVAIENVMGFSGSRVEAYLHASLQAHGYHFRSLDLCPTAFGVPMRRPRRFVLIAKHPLEVTEPVNSSVRSKLISFLFANDSALYLPEATMRRYGQGFDIVDWDEDDATLICFTKNYERCMKASGSLIRTKSGVRRISPEEILGLLGFDQEYEFPPHLSRNICWRLAGNSVDVRAIQHILQSVGHSLFHDNETRAGSKPW
ncbi:MAG TPA: DNA cytosine methyltransferase [Planktothrix sp.]|jgi:site-specific DNA-cytosine methylase